MTGRLVAAGLVLAALGIAGCAGATKTVTLTHTQTVTTASTSTVTNPAPAAVQPCSGGQLSGSFALVPGSAGAGQIGYVLTVRNASQEECYVSGIPQVQLLTADGSPVPTQLEVARSRTAQAERITLRASASTAAHARFSPDIPGPDDSQNGPCQAKAYRLRFTPDGGGSVVVPIRPPTTVCEGGTLSFLFFGASGD